MKKEYGNLLDSARYQRGENYHLTSRELAGSYPLVESGVNDENGTYIGQLYGELNSDPVLLDTMNFKKLAVVCARNRASDINSVARRTKYNFAATTAWSNKITQDAIMNGNRVVEYVLNSEHVERMRPELMSETAYINLLDGRVAINMFETFARGRDNNAAWNMLVSKIQEIARQFSEKEDANDTSILMGEDIDELSRILKEFYIEEELWKDDPEDIRFNNLYHSEYPILQQFNFFLQSKLEQEEDQVSVLGTSQRLKSLRILARTFEKYVLEVNHCLIKEQQSKNHILKIKVKLSLILNL